jgi:NH3-dependent NAD+ synthetase
MVYRLAKYRNSINYVIPGRVIDRAPSAELAPNQVDQDSLPEYDELDAILTTRFTVFLSCPRCTIRSAEYFLSMNNSKIASSSSYNQ